MVLTTLDMIQQSGAQSLHEACRAGLSCSEELSGLNDPYGLLSSSSCHIMAECPVGCARCNG